MVQEENITKSCLHRDIFALILETLLEKQTAGSNSVLIRGIERYYF